MDRSEDILNEEMTFGSQSLHSLGSFKTQIALILVRVWSRRGKQFASPNLSFLHDVLY